MSKAALDRIFRNFRTDTSGSATVEFVILFPAIVMMILAIIALCIFIACLSEVHQLATELTRMSVRYVDLGYSSTDICQRLSDDVLPRSLEGLVFVDIGALETVQCSVMQVPDTTSVAVTYDFGRSEFGGVLGLIGMDGLQVTRSALMYL